jgi:hypothetical protein
MRETLTVGIEAKVCGEETTNIDTKGSHLCSNTFVDRSTCELRIDLLKELGNIAEHVT